MAETDTRAEAALRRQAEDMVAKILVLAHKPVDDLVRTLTLQGWAANYRAIALEAVARYALREAAKGLANEAGPATPGAPAR